MSDLMWVLLVPASATPAWFSVSSLFAVVARVMPSIPQGSVSNTTRGELPVTRPTGNAHARQQQQTGHDERSIEATKSSRPGARPGMMGADLSDSQPSHFVM